MTQRQLPLVDARESKLERMHRVLAGIPSGNVAVAAKYFDDREADRLAALHAADADDEPDGLTQTHGRS